MWFVDETYVKVAGASRYVYRGVDEHGQVIDVLVSRRRDIAAARAFFAAALVAHDQPEVVTDRAMALAHVIVKLLPDSVRNTDQYATTGSSATTVDSKRDYDRCSSTQPDRTASITIPATPSSTTSDEATTNSA